MNIPWEESAREMFEAMIKEVKKSGLPGEREDHINEIEYDAKYSARNASNTTKRNITPIVLDVHVRHHFQAAWAKFNTRRPG